MGETVLFGELFEWDEDKASDNQSKHKGVTFEEGASVFDDGNALYDFDFDNSHEEDRFVVIGRSNGQRTIVESYTY